MRTLRSFSTLIAASAIVLGALHAPLAHGHGTPAPLAADVRARVLGQGAAELAQRKTDLLARAQALRGAAASMEITALKGKGAKALKVSYRDSAGDKRRLLLRVPGRGTGWGGRANDAVHMLAAQLGEPAWVPASIVAEPQVLEGLQGLHVDTGRKTQDDVGKVMVVEFVDKRFKDGEDAPVEWLRKIPEASRLKAAVIDLLSMSRDRKLANVMVDEHGEIRLIDHDVTFGMKSEKGPHFPSSFWKGQALGYTSPQARFEDLPEPARKLVQSLAEEQDLDALKNVYPLSREDRLPQVQAMARAIMQHGLDGAVQQLLAVSESKGFLHRDDNANAIALRGTN